MSAKDIWPEYLAAGANRQTAVADWSASGLLAFGADVNVALWQPSADPPTGVSSLLTGHTECVKAVAFVPEAETDEATYLVTGSDDKKVILWTSPRGGTGFSIVQVLDDHTAPINCIATYRCPTPGRPAIVVTGGADATIKIWTLMDGVLHLSQSTKTEPKYFPLCIAIDALDSDDAAGERLVLAAAGTRDIVQIFTAEAAAAAAARAVLEGSRPISGVGGRLLWKTFHRILCQPEPGEGRLFAIDILVHHLCPLPDL
jgi:elongator complex protein 2